MKVVLFCGGKGTRLRDYSEDIPKPMVCVGYRPILWNVMKFYAHHGHKDFILCLGHGGDTIKRYFLQYDECVSNDFVLTGGGKRVQLLNSDIQDWRISFVDTGLEASVGERLKAVEPLIGEDEVFLANYADGLCDVDLNAHIRRFEESGRVASFLAVRPHYTFHVVDVDADQRVNALQHCRESELWINGGFFVFRKRVFDYIGPGEDLVNGPFHRLMSDGELLAYRHDGYWACMDTFRDKMNFDEMYSREERPWEVWRNGA